ncbi:MAG: gamma-glutamyltransferase family protein [Phycisphaerae bacterium]|nr:gamma-glutamyltransferase family protein [Phycisphaerae bacterium]
MKWTFPYSSRRMPVLARRMVATGQPLAAQAGLEMLRAGGNAVDAAIATAAALTVVEPTANGLGSDAFAIVWDGTTLHGLNASGRSPASATVDRLGDATKVPSLGWQAVTVPGAISAWVELSKRFGSLPFERLLEPAIEYAARGYPVSPQCASGWDRAVERYRDFEAWRKTFARSGAAPRAGEIVSLPDHAATLKAIAESRGASFYRGALAKAIAAASNEAGGWISLDDLGTHEPIWVEPWRVEHSGAQLCELPPNGQGVAALEALGILSRFDLSTLDRDCPDLLHLEIESMKAAFADARARIADPALGLDRAKELIDPRFLDQRAGEIDSSRAREWGPGELKPGGTVYLCAADDSGMMVSYIQSNYEGFGSGVVVPGTGISLQNRGACFSMEAGHPNRYGPSKRPYQTIIPGFLMRGDEPLAAFGVMGGFMQPQGHLQVAVRLLDQDLNPQAALDGPRFQVMDDGSVAVEPGFTAETLQELERRGHRIDRRSEKSVVFGGGQIVWRGEGGTWIGASDSRRDGQAVGS